MKKKLKTYKKNESTPVVMEYHGVDSRGDYKYYCPICGEGGSFMGIIKEPLKCYNKH